MFGPGDPQWTKGDEILVGAHLAIKEINESSNLLSVYQLRVLPVRVPQCELSEGIVPFVEEITSNCKITDILGYFCNTIAQHLSQIAHTWITHIVQTLAASQKVEFVDSKRAFLKTAKEYGIQTETRIEVFNSPKNSC